MRMPLSSVGRKCPHRAVSVSVKLRSVLCRVPITLLWPRVRVLPSIGLTYWNSGSANNCVGNVLVLAYLDIYSHCAWAMESISDRRWCDRREHRFAINRWVLHDLRNRVRAHRLYLGQGECPTRTAIVSLAPTDAGAYALAGPHMKGVSVPSGPSCADDYCGRGDPQADQSG